MIRIVQKGDFSKTKRYFTKLKNVTKTAILNKYGQIGVNALASATPVDSGFTASSWDYKIEHDASIDKIVFTNANINDGVLIAVILQYGHGTGTGGWVEGRDYINPAMQPVFDTMVEEVWREVTSL